MSRPIRPPTRRFSGLACALVVLVGCPSATTPLPPPSAEDAVAAERRALEAKLLLLSKEAEGLLRDQAELVWRNWTEGAPVDIGKTYEGHDALFTVENIRAIAKLRDLTTDVSERRALTNLHGHFVGEYLARELSEVTDAIANLQSSVTFVYDGKDVPYRELDKVLANERDGAKRRALYEAATPAVQRLAQSWKRKDERIDELLRTLGYASYLEYASELRQADLERLQILATQVLDVTDDAWKRVLSELGKRELSRAAVLRADFPRLFRAHNVDVSFPKEQVLPRAKQTLAGMSLNVDALKQLRLDEADRRGKNPRPLTLPVSVPNDIRLSVKPQAGVRAQGQTLHEFGHALHFAHGPSARFELTKLGNDTAAEAMGFLFEDLIEDPVWLEQFAGLSAEKARDYLWAQSAHKLFIVRRAAGRILYELSVHGPAAPDATSTYASLMSRAYGVPVEGFDLERAGVEREDFIESADAFRAWFLAGQLQGELKSRFGPSWWNSPQAGDFLKKLWANSGAASAREVARQLGATGIKPDVVLLRISSGLQLPITLPATPAELEPAAGG